jgi:uncharacterized SAM-binding protein YcdF (DUF218 family)
MSGSAKKKFVLIFSILVIVIFLSAPLWLTKLGGFLILNKTPQKADVIIVLSGDDEGERLRYAYYLFQKGYAPKILIAGSTSLWEETGIDLMEKYLIQLGVPIKDIFSEKQSESTVENALHARRLLEEMGFRSAIVVTSPTHTRRASIIFNKTFTSKMTALVSSDPKTFQPEGWWRDPRRRRAVLREYFQIGWYLLFGD